MYNEIKQIISHTETGFGTHVICGLGKDGNVYEWKECSRWERNDGEEWQPQSGEKYGWILRDGKPKD